MLVIKKVASTPLDEDGGNIIDSFNTTDDKHLNAPSLNAVTDYVGEVQKATETVTKSVSIGDIVFNLTFRRNAQVVIVNINTNIPIIDPGTSGYVSATRLVNLTSIFPEWAKVNYNGVLDNQSYISGMTHIVVGSTNAIGLAEGFSVSLSKSTSGNYNLTFSFMTTNSYPEGSTINFHLKYIVE